MDDLSDLDACTAAVFKTVSTGTVQEVRAAIDNYQIPDKDKDRYRDKLDYLRCQHNKRYQSLLHYAAMYNSEDVLWLLITDFKFSLYTTDNDQVCPFMYALKKGLYIFVSKNCLSLSAKDTYQNNIIHYCCGGGVEIPVFGGTQSLTAINKDDCLQFIKSIIKQEQGKSSKSFDIYHINTNGISTLRCALESKLDNVAAWMLSQPNITSLALKQESNQTLGEIGKYGIQIVTSEKPLKYSHAIHVILKRLLTNDTHFTLQEMKNEISQYVKNYRLDVNSTDQNGMTVLHYLCYNQYK